MGNKKLVIINVLTLFAFITVVGAGVYQNETDKDKYGDFSSIDHKTVKNEIKKRDNILLPNHEAEKINPSSIERKMTAGTMVLHDANWYIVQVEEIEEEIVEPIAAEENTTWQEEESTKTNAGGGRNNSWSDSEPVSGNSHSASTEADEHENRNNHEDSKGDKEKQDENGNKDEIDNNEENGNNEEGGEHASPDDPENDDEEHQTDTDDPAEQDDP